MSGVLPSAGSTYTPVQNALSAHIGFLAGWAMILDYFLIPLLSVIYTRRSLAKPAGAAGAVLGKGSRYTVAITLINVRGASARRRARET